MAVPTTLTFTETDWFTPQTVLLTVGEDIAAGSFGDYVIGHAGTSADLNYEGLSVADRTVELRALPGTRQQASRLWVSGSEARSQKSIRQFAQGSSAFKGPRTPAPGGQGVNGCTGGGGLVWHGAGSRGCGQGGGARAALAESGRI